MASRSTVKAEARLVGEAVRQYAAEKSWGEGAYRIFMRARPGGFLHLVLTAPAAALMGGWPISQDHRELRRFLEGRLEGTGILERLRPDVRSFEQVDAGGYDAISPDYSEYVYDPERARHVFRRLS